MFNAIEDFNKNFINLSMQTKYLSKIRGHYKDIESTGSVYGEQNFLHSVAMLFHESSKLTKFTSRLLGIKVQNFNNEYFHTRASQPYKVNPGCELISMNEFKSTETPQVDLFKTIKCRRSIRKFSGHNISLKDLYQILQFSYGISCKNPIHGVDEGCWCYRNVPSGGALYPLEIYVSVFNGEIEPGLYHYRPDIDSLEVLNQGNHYEALNTVITAEPIVDFKNSSCTIFITSVFERVLIKYGDRGYRFVLMETGFVAENMSLICEAIGLGSCMIGGYQDDKVNEYLGISGLSESVQNVLIIGKAKESNDLNHSL
jgi:SagB-type dehydrogenase family enzyme